MVILDGTIVNVALPTIRTEVGFSEAALAWVVNGFFVLFALLLLPAGRLADLVGTAPGVPRRTTVFTLARSGVASRGVPARSSPAAPPRAWVARSARRWCSG